MTDKIKLHIDNFLTLWQMMREGELPSSFNQQRLIVYLPILGLALGLINLFATLLVDYLLIGSPLKSILVLVSLLIILQHFLEKPHHFHSLKNLADIFEEKKHPESSFNYKLIVNSCFVLLQFLAFSIAISSNNLWLLVMAPTLSYLCLANTYFIQNSHQQRDKMNLLWLGLAIIFIFLSSTSLLFFTFIWFAQKIIYSKLRKQNLTKDIYQVNNVLSTALIYALILLIYG